jgi:hypothetical protein
LSGYGLRRCSPRYPIATHDPATLNTAPGKHQQNRIHFSLPASLVQEGNFDQNQRCLLETDLLAHRFPRQGMEESINLTAGLCVIENALAQSDPVDRAIFSEKYLAKLGTKSKPSRLIDIQQMPAALININERDEAITGQ